MSTILFQSQCAAWQPFCFSLKVLWEAQKEWLNFADDPVYTYIRSKLSNCDESSLVQVMAWHQPVPMNGNDHSITVHIDMIEALPGQASMS